MSLTLPDKYLAFARMNAPTEDWVVKLFFDDESAADYIGIAFKDVIVSSIQYYGVIVDVGSVDHKIDLKKQVAYKQDVTITCVNKWKTGTLAEELHYGTYKYLNRKVEIYSILSANNNPSAVTDGVKIYVGVLKGLHITDDGLLELNIQQRYYTSGTTIPQVKSDQGVYYPVVYGDYQLNYSTNFDYKKVYPCPQNNGSGYWTSGNYYLEYLTAEDYTAKAPLVYLTGIDGFDYINGFSSDTKFYVATIQDIYAYIRPYMEDPDYANNGDFSNPENAIDFWDEPDFSTTYAEYTDTNVSGGGTTTTGLNFDIPGEYRKLITCKVYYRMSLTVSNLTYDAGEDPGGSLPVGP